MATKNKGQLGAVPGCLSHALAVQGTAACVVRNPTTFALPGENVEGCRNYLHRTATATTTYVPRWNGFGAPAERDVKFSYLSGAHTSRSGQLKGPGLLPTLHYIILILIQLALGHRFMIPVSSFERAVQFSAMVGIQPGPRLPIVLLWQTQTTCALFRSFPDPFLHQRCQKKHCPTNQRPMSLIVLEAQHSR
jgi:hypothetical protein